MSFDHVFWSELKTLTFLHGTVLPGLLQVHYISLQGLLFWIEQRSMVWKIIYFPSETYLPCLGFRTVTRYIHPMNNQYENNHYTSKKQYNLPE